MRIQMERVCTGNLSIITKHNRITDLSMREIDGIGEIGHIESESIPYEECVPLIKIDNEKYVTLDHVVSFLDKRKLKKLLKKADLGKPILPDGSFVLDIRDGHVGDFIVQEDTVEPFYHTNFPKITKSFRKVRDELCMKIGTHW